MLRTVHLSLLSFFLRGRKTLTPEKLLSTPPTSWTAILGIDAFEITYTGIVT